MEGLVVYPHHGGVRGDGSATGRTATGGRGLTDLLDELQLGVARIDSWHTAPLCDVEDCPASAPAGAALSAA